MTQALVMWFVFLMWVNLPLMYLHRSLTHNQFRFHPIMLTVLKIMAWLSKPKYVPGGERAWVAIHRMHHRHTDAEQDPHSPYVLGTLGVILNRRRFFSETEINDNTKNLRLQIDQLDAILAKLPIGRAVLLFIFLWLFSWSGTILWIGCIYSQYAHTFFNYATHKWIGYNNAPPLKNDRSRNVPYLMFLFLGEELHGNHHRWPGRPNNAVRWWEIDLGYWFLKMLSFFGLVKFNRA